MCHVNPESAYLLLKWLSWLQRSSPTPCIILNSSLVLWVIHITSNKEALLDLISPLCSSLLAFSSQYSLHRNYSIFLLVFVSPTRALWMQWLYHLLYSQCLTHGRHLINFLNNTSDHALEPLLFCTQNIIWQAYPCDLSKAASSNKNSDGCGALEIRPVWPRNFKFNLIFINLNLNSHIADGYWIG